MQDIYAVLFSDGVIKVGRGKNAKQRIVCHASASKVRGATVVKEHIVRLVPKAQHQEKRLIDFCAQNGNPITREWFTGLCMEKVISWIDLEIGVTSLEGDDVKIKEFKEASAKDDEAFAKALLEKFPAKKMPDIELVKAFGAAGALQAIYLNYMGYGGVFEKGEWGVSFFELSAALYMYKMPSEKIGYLFSRAFDDSDGAFDEIMKGAKERSEASKLLPERATIMTIEGATGQSFEFAFLQKWCDENSQQPMIVSDDRFDGGVEAWPAGAWLAAYGINLAEIF